MEDIIDNNTKARGVPLLKERYQATIRELLSRPDHPTVSLHDLERFKQNFRTSAYTCQIWSCRHAVFGFNSSKDLKHHEADHRKKLCHHPNCQYPVFNSAESLRDHTEKSHVQSSQIIPRKSIKKHTQPSASASTASASLQAPLLDWGSSLDFNRVNLTAVDVLNDFDFDEYLNDDDNGNEDFVFTGGYSGME